MESFIIKKQSLLASQYYAIKGHSLSGLKNADIDPWIISEDDDEIKGESKMNKFDMAYYLKLLGVSKPYRWNDSNDFNWENFNNIAFKWHALIGG